MLVSQPTFNTINIKQGNNECNVSAWNSKEIYNPELSQLHDFASVIIFWRKIAMSFNNSVFTIKQGNYKTNIANAYIVYDLDAWPKTPLNNFKIKNCLSIVKNSYKEKWVHRGCGITCHGAGSWSLGNDFARYVVNFCFDNSLSSHADDCQSNFLVIGKGPTYGVHESFVSPEKKFSFKFGEAHTKFCLCLLYNHDNICCIKFSKANTKLCLSFRYNNDNSYLFANGKEIYMFKSDNKNVNFPTQFWLESLSNKFAAIDSREVSLKGNVYNFSVDYNPINKSNMLNIYKHLMVKDNT